MATKTKKEKLTDSLKKMTKKSKTTDKDALKNLLLKDMKDQKEQERLQRVEENKNLQEIIIYTKFSCPFCKQMIDLLESEGIKYTEKSHIEHEDEWNQIIGLTNTPVFPTLVVNGEYLAPRRDFNQPQQAINIIKVLAKKGFKMPSNELRIREALKTLGANIQQSNQNIIQQIQQLHKRLEPIQQFINKLKEEIESEDE